MNALSDEENLHLNMTHLNHKKSEKYINEDTTRELIESCRLLHESIQLLATINEVNIDQYQYSTSIQEVSLTLASLEQCFITYLHVLLSSVSNKDYSEIDFITRPETHQLIYFASLLQNGNLQIKMYGSGGFGGADSIIYYVKIVLKQLYETLESYLKSFYPYLSRSILVKNGDASEQNENKLNYGKLTSSCSDIKNSKQTKTSKMHKIINQRIKMLRKVYAPSFKRIIPLTIIR